MMDPRLLFLFEYHLFSSFNLDLLTLKMNSTYVCKEYLRFADMLFFFPNCKLPTHLITNTLNCFRINHSSWLHSMLWIVQLPLRKCLNKWLMSYLDCRWKIIVNHDWFEVCSFTYSFNVIVCVLKKSRPIVERLWCHWIIWMEEVGLCLELS